MLVEVERHERVAIVTLNRPEARNAINVEITRELANTFDEFERDDDVWAVVITGAGDRAFCAGADLKGAASGETQAAFGDPSKRPAGGFASINKRDFPKPMIAAVNGAALGGGFEIALSCDLVVAEEHAVFGLPEVKWGIVASAGGLVRLAHRIPLPLALEIALVAEPINAQRAYELGLVNRVVPKGQSKDEAITFATRICQHAPLAVRMSKRILRESIAVTEDEMWRRQADYLVELRANFDSTAGPRAFAEKRTPVWDKPEGS
jgi:enoyl-CoA hydratase/carnithine racemase